MSIDKNFVIKNGLEVDSGTLFVNSDNNKVGVGTTNPNYNLEIKGTIGLSSAISVGGTTGVSGQALFSTGDGAEWRALPNLRESLLEVSTDGQTIFPASSVFDHNPLLLDVFLNGVKLRQVTEYTSINNDSKVQLLVPTFDGDIIELITYSATSFASGAQGVQGFGGVDGAQGTQGIQGTDGAFAAQGIQGIQGLQGFGLQGFEGIPGPSGNQGIQGLQGIQGDRGVQGSNGPQGFQGLQGFGGPIGIQGSIGFQGIQGIQGITGIQGIQGNDGQTGATGVQGADGAFAAQGIQGIQGIQGGIGNTGTQGTQGIQGIGNTGAQGIQGTSGLFAGQGIQGTQGLQGTIGAQGISGSFAGQGIQGIQGVQGILGVQGGDGVQGVQGITGRQGTQGLQGTQGPFGAQGPLGFQGNQGVQGTQGLVGPIGAQGTDGAFAAQGIQGPQGITGAQGASSFADGYWEKNIYTSGISTTSDVGIGTTSVSGPNAVDSANTRTLAVGSIRTRNVNSINLNLSGIASIGSGLNVAGITTLTSGRIQIDGSQNIRIGNAAAGSGSNRNIAIGDQVLGSLSGGNGRNIGIGEFALNDTTNGEYNVGLGVRAGQNITSGSYNVIIGGYDGDASGLNITGSSNNVVIADGEGNIRQYINSSGNVGIKTTVVTEALTVAGIVSATSFYGTLNAGQLTGALPALDGSALIGVVGSGSGFVIEDDATPVGTAGTINFGSNISVSFASGIATVSVPSVSYASVAGVATVATNAQGLTGTPSISVSNVTANRLILPDCGNIENTDNTEKLTFGTTPDFKIYHLNQNPFEVQNRIEVKTNPLYIGTIEEISPTNFYHTSLISVIPNTTNARVELGFGTSYPNTKLTTTGYGVSITGGINAPTGIITASSFSGSASGLTNIPAGQLTGALPALDGSALTGVIASGTGIEFQNNDSIVGSAGTVNFGTGLDVQYNSNAGIATIVASGGSLQSRTTVSGSTTSIANNATGYISITGFKSYALMHVGLSTAGWIRLYTDSTSRSNDSTRSLGDDPIAGSGVIAEVATSGISTQQNISPFVIGGNMDDPVDTTIYVAITNLSGSTQSITANLKILQLEA